MHNEHSSGSTSSSSPNCASSIGGFCSQASGRHPVPDSKTRPPLRPHRLLDLRHDLACAEDAQSAWAGRTGRPVHTAAAKTVQAAVAQLLGAARPLCYRVQALSFRAWWTSWPCLVSCLPCPSIEPVLLLFTSKQQMRDAFGWYARTTFAIVRVVRGTS